MIAQHSLFEELIPNQTQFTPKFKARQIVFLERPSIYYFKLLFPFWLILQSSADRTKPVQYLCTPVPIGCYALDPSWISETTLQSAKMTFAVTMTDILAWYTKANRFRAVESCNRTRNGSFKTFNTPSELKRLTQIGVHFLEISDAYLEYHLPPLAEERDLITELEARAYPWRVGMVNADNFLIQRDLIKTITDTHQLQIIKPFL
jgi:hypothetical protein